MSSRIEILLVGLRETSPVSLASVVLTLYLSSRLFRWAWKTFFALSPFRHVPGPPRLSWAKGNLGQLFSPKGLPFHLNLVDQYGGMVKVHGFFGDEQLYISDPRALQSVVLKDQDAFEETSVFIETNKIIFGPGLVATTGDQHRKQRKMAKPVFSPTHLKALRPVFYDIAEKLSDVLVKEAKAHDILDMSEWMCRVALEAVGQTILGHSFDPLDSPGSNPYTFAIKELIPTIFSLSLLRQFAPFFARLGSPSFRRRLVERIPHGAVQKIKDISDVMHNTAVGILDQKRGALKNEGGLDSSSKDIINLLLQANEMAEKHEKMSDLELTGQMTVLIFGAQDTTSSAMSRILYMLARHPDIQDRLREEVKSALEEHAKIGENDRLEYDELLALPLFDAIIKETLRLYPPVPFARRTCIKERTVPYATSDSNISHVTIPVGTTIFVAIAGANRLESIWGPDAKEWKPARWLSGSDTANPASPRLPGIYAGMMSFLGGGRSCIGYQFALLEMKIMLSVLILRLRFFLTDEQIGWNLSQIISPSIRGKNNEETKGLPLKVEILEDS